MDEGQKWTNLKRQEIAQLIEVEGKAISVTLVDQLLVKHNYRKRKAQKRLSTGETAQRNEQFENIGNLRKTYQDRITRVLSMDTKKKN
jgi:Rhodopirellula transposase DDE domain